MVSNESLVLVKNYITLIITSESLKATVTIVRYAAENRDSSGLVRSLSANAHPLKGMNHNSFTYDNDDDTVPDWVLENDLKAEISKEGAITSITEFAAHFMDFCQR